MSSNEEVGRQPSYARIAAEAHVLRDDARVKQAALIDYHSIGDGFDGADLLEIFVGSVDVARLRAQASGLGFGGAHEAGDIAFGHALDPSGALAIEGGAGC